MRYVCPLYFIELPTGNTITVGKVKALNDAGNITRNLENPPVKDTVAVPDAGFTLIRFVADNPGFWLIHGTTTWFEYMGMGVILEVILSQNKFELHFITRKKLLFKHVFTSLYSIYFYYRLGKEMTLSVTPPTDFLLVTIFHTNRNQKYFHSEDRKN